jgi:hypothetical protein
VTPKHWLALAGGSPLLALELAGSASERALLDSLIAQVSRAERLDPLSAAAAQIDKCREGRKAAGASETHDRLGAEMAVSI